MTDPVYRNATEAWVAFQKIGGLDLADRDADLEAEILSRLGQPWAPGLQYALVETTPDDLVRALFGSISPFVEMFRATLEFFKAAGASQGREQWQIKIEDEHLGLEAFEQFLTAVSDVPGTLDVPDIDRRTLSLAREVLNSTMADAWPPRGSRTGDVEVDAWLEAYGAGGFPDLPAGVLALDLPSCLRDIRAMLSARLAIARSYMGGRSFLGRPGWREAYDFRTTDPFEPPVVAQDETDFWSEYTLRALHASTALSSPALDELNERLQALFAGPRRALEHSVQSGQLERILSLPVWKRRHELYAVWVATEIVGALPDHQVELLHEDGRIVFAFKATEVARVLTSRPERRLISERKTPLASPVGKGRTVNVQPDYGIWSADGDDDTCRLVVEVKHYKRAKNRAFREVLQDYAAAHRSAQVVLVNHGPVGKVIDDSFDRHLGLRCRTIERLTPRHPGARAALTELVREAVGEPVRLTARFEAEGGALLVDVSGSMQSALRPDILRQMVGLAGGLGVAEVLLTDIEVIETVRLDALLEVDFARLPWRGTTLEPLIARLLTSMARLLVFTDDDGLRQVRAAGGVADLLESWGGAHLADVRRR